MAAAAERLDVQCGGGPADTVTVQSYAVQWGSGIIEAIICTRCGEAFPPAGPRRSLQSALSFFLYHRL